jgi:hypothetical protein
MKSTAIVPALGPRAEAHAAPPDGEVIETA